MDMSRFYGARRRTQPLCYDAESLTDRLFRGPEFYDHGSKFHQSDDLSILVAHSRRQLFQLGRLHVEDLKLMDQLRGTRLPIGHQKSERQVPSTGMMAHINHEPIIWGRPGNPK